MKTNLCPACINKFLKSHSAEELGDEIIDLRYPEQIEIKNCKEHKNKNLEEEINKAIESTQVIYDRISNIEHEPNRPSQEKEVKKEKLSPKSLRLVN